MGTIRSFIAVPIHGMSDIATIAREMGSIRGIKGVRPENIHLTLKFLGDVEEDSEMPRIRGLLREVAIRHAPLVVEIGKTGAFPKTGRMRVAWIGIDSTALEELARDVIATLPLKQGEKPQSFNPHLTIGRVKFSEGINDARKLLDRYRDHHFGTMNVHEFHLMKSTLTPQGPIYEILECFALIQPPKSE